MNFNRRLAAIFIADVAGYSRLMGQDEERTRSRLRHCLETIVQPSLSEHGGRLVKTMGDGFLVEFTSVLGAVQAALQIQAGAASLNNGVAVDDRMDFRVGIHLGDVIVEDDDIHGDGVNVASRLETLADPGGICVSADVERHSRGKLDARFVDLGKHELKNIAQPVQVYRVLPKGEPVSETLASKPTSRWRMPTITLCLLLITVPAGIWWWQQNRAGLEVPPAEQETSSTTSKLSIAVLPFTNLSDDPEQTYFAEGMAGDINTALATLDALDVVSGTATFRSEDGGTDVKEIGDRLGVGYVLQGAVRRAGDQIRINAQLIEASTRRQLWAERYEGKLNETFALQDQVTGRIVEALSLELGTEEKSAIG